MCSYLPQQPFLKHSSWSYLGSLEIQLTIRFEIQPSSTELAHYWGRGSSSLCFSSALQMNCSVVPSLGRSQKMALSEQTGHWELWHFGVRNKALEFQGVCCECTPRTSRSCFMPARSDEEIKSMVLIVQKLPAKYAQPFIFHSFLNEMHGCQTNQGL